MDSISNASEKGFEKASEYRLSRIVFRGDLGRYLLLGFVLEGKERKGKERKGKEKLRKRKKEEEKVRINPSFSLCFSNSFLIYKKKKQKVIENENEWRCVRDSSGKPGAVENREDLERIARPEGARPCCLSDECFANAFGECLRRLCENEN